MHFRDAKLQEHYDRVVCLMSSLPEDLRDVAALMDVYTWFRLIEGEQAQRVQDAFRCLTAPELRDPLKKWYAKFGRNMNEGAKEFHDVLERATGDAFPVE